MSVRVVFRFNFLLLLLLLLYFFLSVVVHFARCEIWFMPGFREGFSLCINMKYEIHPVTEWKKTKKKTTTIHEHRNAEKHDPNYRIHQAHTHTHTYVSKPKILNRNKKVRDIFMKTDGTYKETRKSHEMRKTAKCATHAEE